MKSFAICIYFLFRIYTLHSQTISIDEVNDHIKDSVTICGNIVSAFYYNNQINKPTYLNMTSSDSSKKLSIVIYENIRNQWPVSPEITYLNKKICVNGKVFLYRGRPLIIIKNIKQIQISE